MWVRKPNSELQRCKKIRLRNYEVFSFAFCCLFAMLIYLYAGSFKNLFALINDTPELMFYIFLLPIFFILGYRSYVLYGKINYNLVTGKVCLSCGIGLGYGDDNHGFKHYGTGKKKWYQSEVCKTPEECDIAYMHEVKWIQGNPNDDINAGDKKQINKNYKFSVSYKDIGTLLILLLFALLIIIFPFLIGWIFYNLF